MDSQLNTINKQIKDENNRHNRVIADLNAKKQKENEQHQRIISLLNYRKSQINNN